MYWLNSVLQIMMIESGLFLVLKEDLISPGVSKTRNLFFFSFFLIWKKGGMLFFSFLNVSITKSNDNARLYTEIF